MSNNEKFTLYSYVGSQWAMVAHLGLVEKGIKPEEYEIKEIDLFTAANFEPEYLEINPNGTIPSLVSPNLDQPLIQSMDVLRWLDKAREKTVLVPEDDATKERMQQIIDLIHDESISTDLILLQARSMEELEAKKSEGWLGFLAARQEKLEKEKVLRPEHPFYGPKSKENGSIYHIYTTEESPEHHAFFKMTHDMYRHLASEMDRLEELIALPYAAGDQVTEADLNVVPWFAHAMAGAGTKPTDILNFQPLENVIRKSVENFEIGPKTKQWWSNVAKRESFKQVYPTLH